RQVRGMIAERGLHCDLEVDGGVNLETAPLAAAAGANDLVAGTSVYGHRAGVAAGVRELLEACRTVQQARS
ncbi:MAG: ribulose-phosphate 3-epimerase, partial [Terriglobia bacterium]